MVKTLVADLRRSCQDSRSNRQIEGSPLLANIGRREISGDSGRWEVEAGVLDCRRHALAALFYRAIRQPDRIEGRQSICDVDLYLNNVASMPMTALLCIIASISTSSSHHHFERTTPKSLRGNLRIPILPSASYSSRRRVQAQLRFTAKTGEPYRIFREIGDLMIKIPRYKSGKKINSRNSLIGLLLPIFRRLRKPNNISPNLRFIVDVHMPLRWSGRDRYLDATDIALRWSARHDQYLVTEAQRCYKGFAPEERHVYRKQMYNHLALQRSAILGYLSNNDSPNSN